MGCFPNVDAKYTTLWFGETFCFASVNCYALISGYVMYNHKATAGKLLNMWGQVFSISALTGLYFIIFKDANIPADKIQTLSDHLLVLSIGILQPILVCILLFQY